VSLMAEEPIIVDWVTARAGFSVEAAFRQLLENVRSDRRCLEGSPQGARP